METAIEHYMTGNASHDSNTNLHRISRDATKFRTGLSFPSYEHLCGREEELERFHEAYQRVLFSDSSNSELILISGRSGVGKTVLAKTVQQHITLNGGNFITGKCDQMQIDEPYTAIVAAFTEFVKLTLAKGDDSISLMKEEILRIAGSDSRLLVDMIPAFKQIVGTQHTYDCALNREQVQNRLKTIFFKLVRKLCSIEHPLVILMDDMQWVDSGSLEMLHLLVSGDKIQGLVIICVCRDNDVTFDHDFAAMLRHLEDSKKTRVTHIEVKNLSLDVTNDLISCQLNISSDVCKPLTEVVHKKTKGNAFFTLQFIEALQEDGVLLILSGGKIRWDNTLLQNLAADIDVAVDLVARKIRRLPEDVQMILTYAACIGAKVNENILSKILNGKDVKRALSIFLNQNMILYEKLNNRYIFSHDRIQQGAYDIIPSKEKSATHLMLGRLLLKYLTAEEVTDHIFVIVNQFRLGKKCMENQNEKESISFLCLEAGEKSILSSNFKTAASYLWLGIDFLGQRGWRNQYQLSLQLHNLIAETEYCSGNFEKMDKAVHAIFLNALNFSDKVWASTTLVYAFYARSRLQEAMDVGLDLLKRLGENFPKHSLLNILADIKKTKRLLRGKADAELLNHPDIESIEKIGAMKALNVLIPISAHVRHELFPYIANRMMRISIKFGLCAVSAVGFAAYGICCCKLGNYEDGDRYGKLALRILERYDTAGYQWIPRVYVIVYAYIAVWKVPLRNILDKLLKAHQVGRQTGDIEFAITSVRFYSIIAMLSGVRLVDIESRIDSCREIMDQHKQSTRRMGNALQLQFINNLTGRSDDPLLLKGNAVLDPEELLKEAIDSGDRSTCFFHYLYSIMLAYHFSAFELGYKYSKKLSKNYIMDSHVCNPTFYFYKGMITLGMAWKYQKKRKKYIRIAMGSMKRLKKLQLCPSNSKHMIILLQAEIEAIKNNTNLALVKFNEAAFVAGKEGYIQYQAIACECAGLMLQRKSRKVEGEAYIRRAICLYDAWGATAKVNQIIDDNEELSYTFLNRKTIPIQNDKHFSSLMVKQLSTSQRQEIVSRVA